MAPRVSPGSTRYVCGVAGAEEAGGDDEDVGGDDGWTLGPGVGDAAGDVTEEATGDGSLPAADGSGPSDDGAAVPGCSRRATATATTATAMSAPSVAWATRRFDATAGSGSAGRV